MPKYCTKLTLFSRSWLLVIIVFYLTNTRLWAQDCGLSTLGYDQNIRSIPWSSFSEFSLPFTLIYGGPVDAVNIAAPLTHGFTHMGNVSFLGNVPANQRALIYYGTAITQTNQPWENIRSPWGNNLNIYQTKWQNDFKNLSTATSNDLFIDADIFVFDIERHWRFDFEILQFKSNSELSSAYKDLDNITFLNTYKADMRSLYAKSAEAILSNQPANSLKIGSYADSPIVNTFANIQGNSWADWQTDKAVVNYITTDISGNVGGAFFDQLTMANPSAYYYYDYPHPFAGEYLSYLLFQIEANKVWTNKPIIPFVWLRYSFNTDVAQKPIKPWMAESTAIFPFFSGADGLWLWENPTIEDQTDLAANYGAFISGLSRLAYFKRFFEGEKILIQDISARDYNENKMPIWRGAVKGNEILIAAHNPFAKSETEQVSIQVSYGNWSKTITLTGYENFLCAFDLAESEDDLVVYPNPNRGLLNLNFASANNTSGFLKLIGPAGQDISKYPITFNENSLISQELVIPKNGYSWIFVELLVGDKRYVKKIVLE